MHIIDFAPDLEAGSHRIENTAVFQTLSPLKGSAATDWPRLQCTLCSSAVSRPAKSASHEIFIGLSLWAPIFPTGWYTVTCVLSYPP